MCYILVYIVFVPIARELVARPDNPFISTATILSLVVVVSFCLVYRSQTITSIAQRLLVNVERLFILDFLSQYYFHSRLLYARSLGKAKTPKTTNVRKRIAEKQMNVEIQKNGIETYKRNVRKPLMTEAYYLFFLCYLLVAAALQTVKGSGGVRCLIFYHLPIF